MSNPTKIEIGGGSARVPGYFDICLKGDISIDLEKELLPLEDNSVEKLICMCTMQYFTKDRAKEIIDDIYRVLKVGGIARFGVPDGRIWIKEHIKDGELLCSWNEFTDLFYGYPVGKNKDHPTKYIYDYETFASLFSKFSVVERKQPFESRFEDVKLIDNRIEGMLFLEARKIY